MSAMQEYVNRSGLGFGLDPILRNIVEAEAKDITRAWRVCEDPAWYQVERRYSLTQKIQELIVKAKMFGGAWWLPLYEEGVDLAQPLRPTDRITGFRVVSAAHVRYGSMPGLYTVSTALTTNIHPTRMVLAPHNQIYTEQEFSTGQVFTGEGDVAALSRYLSPMNDADAELLILMRKAIIDVRSQDGLMEMAENAARNGALAAQFERIMSFLKEAATKAGNSVGIVSDMHREKVERLSVAGGISTLVAIPERFGNLLVAASGLPKTKVFGDQQAGLQNNGSADLRKYYDACESLRSGYVYDAITMADQLMGATEKKTPPAWEFGNFWQETEVEKAATDKLRAEVDAIYAGILGDVVYEPLIESERVQKLFDGINGDTTAT